MKPASSRGGAGGREGKSEEGRTREEDDDGKGAGTGTGGVERGGGMVEEGESNLNG